jgi:hypothetical protein
VAVSFLFQTAETDSGEFVVGHPLCAQDTVNNGTHGQEPRPMHCAVVFFFGKHKSFLTNLMLETVEEVMTIVIDNNL